MQEKMEAIIHLSQDQQTSLVTALLGADLTVAAILFGVLGFVYAVFANLAPPRLPHQPVKELRTPILPHPMLTPLVQLARWIWAGLGVSVITAVGAFVWFLYPQKGVLMGIVAGLLLEVVLLFAIGTNVVFSLMPPTTQEK